MNYRSSTPPVPGLTPSVKMLLFVTVGTWFFGQIILEKFFKLELSGYLSLVPAHVLFNFYLWQPLTYIFLHSLSISHILFNMLMLWWLGSELEQRWGKRFFLAYYILSGVGAGVLYCIIQGIYYWLQNGQSTGMLAPVIGASGAIFGLLMAYGILFGERTILFMMLIPMKAKHMVMILGALDMASLMTQGEGGGIAYLAHLGGLLSGYLVLLGQTRLQQRQWQNKLKSRNQKLKLVVDNEKPKTGEGPKYWN